MPRTHQRRAWKRLLVASACAATVALSGFRPFTDAMRLPHLSSARAMQPERLGELELFLQGVAMQLRSGDKAIRESAMNIISTYGYEILRSDLLTGMAVKGLSGLVRNGDRNEQWLAVMALGHMKCPAAVPAFIEALKSGDEDIQVRAAQALGELGDPRAYPQLIIALHSEYSTVRGYAAWALGEIGDEKAIPALIEATEDGDSEVRGNAAHALGTIGKANPKNPGLLKAVPVLIGLLDDDLCPQVRIYSAWSLGELKDKRAILPLVNAVADEREDHLVLVRAQAAEALGKLGDPRTVFLLLDALKDEDHVVRIYAAMGLGFLGDKRALPALAKAAGSDPDKEVRASAKKAMDEISKPDPKEENPKKD